MEDSRPRLLTRHVASAIAPAATGIFIASVVIRLLALPRAILFNTTLTPAALWRESPALLWPDLVAALTLGLLLCPFEILRLSLKRFAQKLVSTMPIVVTVAATLLLAMQYRVWYEAGFFPSINTFARFAGPNSPFLSTAYSYANATVLSELALVIVIPSAIIVVIRRFPRVAAICTIVLIALIPVTCLWPASPQVSALATHPFLKLPGAEFEQPTPADPEVSADPPSMKSISGLGKRIDCRDRVDPLPGGNIVLVVLESTADQYVFADGQWRFPNLLRMAEHGVRFNHYYSPAGTSNPALYAILMGRHPIPADSWWATPDDRSSQSLPTLLANRGYACGFFMSGCFRYFFDEKLYRGMKWETCLDGDDLSRLLGIAAKDRDPDGHCIDDAVLMRHVVQWIERQCKTNHPWMTVVYPGVPHGPYDFHSRGPHAMHKNDPLTPIQQYDNQLAYVDAQLGLLYDALVRNDFFKSGVLLVTGDHGEAFGQHSGNFLHGTQTYEENLRVPLLLVRPGHVRAGQCTNLGSHVDLAQTLLKLTGSPCPPMSDASDLLAPSGPDMTFLSAAHDSVKLAVVDGPYKCISFTETGECELYRLDEDPGETRNIATTQTELVARYRSWIKSFVYHRLTPVELQVVSPAQREFLAGLEALASGQSPSAAIQHFRRALQIEPGHAEAHEKLAECYYLMGLDRARLSQWTPALQQLEEALRLSPNRVDIRAALADVLARSKRVAEAVATVRQGLAHSHGDESLTLRLAWLLTAQSPYKQRDPAEAARLIETLPQTSGDSVETLLVKACVAATPSKGDQALLLCQAALKLEADRMAWDGGDIERAIRSHIRGYEQGLLPSADAYPFPAWRPLAHRDLMQRPSATSREAGG